MILADKIIEERKKNGWSQEELAEKLGVSRQAVSRWESSGSIPDLQRIIRMAELFGVSTDYLLREDLLPEEASAVYVETDAGDGGTIRRVSMEEANEFLDIKRKGAPIIANAVTMCILSPVLLVVLMAMAEESVFNITEALAGGLGILFLFGMIATAVFMFITHSIRKSRIEYIEKESFETEYGVSGMVKEKNRSFEPTYTRGLALGVVLIILASVPLVIAALMELPDYVIALFVALLFLMIATGVNMIIRVIIIKGSYNALLQEGEFSKAEKRMNEKYSLVAGIYWALATAIYLGWSFLTMRWDISWIVWPVAGVLFAAVLGISKLIIGTGNKNR